MNAKKTNVTISKKNRWDKQCAIECALRKSHVFDSERQKEKSKGTSEECGFKTYCSPDLLFVMNSCLFFEIWESVL